jgi:low temperature requirement protein LtrA
LGKTNRFRKRVSRCRLRKTVLYADASRHGGASAHAIAGFAVAVIVGVALLLVGSFLGGWHRDALWTAALAIDYAGPGWLTRDRLRRLQRVAVAHFAERYALFVIICLGESIVAIGVGASGRALTAERVAAVALGLLTTAGLWWTYFERSASLAERRIREQKEPVLAAADAYSYLHLLIVAGIIVFAVGVKLSVAHAASPLGAGERYALCGGVALYLLAHAAFRLRLASGVNGERLAFAAALLALAALGAGVAAWALVAIAGGVVLAMCAVETAHDRRRVGTRTPIAAGE